MELEEIYIDNMSQQLVINPEQFNNSVLLSTNLFMDIISELASGIVGSIGLIYPANMGNSYARLKLHMVAHRLSKDKTKLTQLQPFLQELGWLNTLVSHT